MKMLGTTMMPRKECKGLKRAYWVIIYGAVDLRMEYNVLGMSVAFVCLLAEVMSSLGAIFL